MQLLRDRLPRIRLYLHLPLNCIESSRVDLKRPVTEDRTRLTCPNDRLVLAAPPITCPTHPRKNGCETSYEVRDSGNGLTRNGGVGQTIAQRTPAERDAGLPHRFLRFNPAMITSRRGVTAQSSVVQRAVPRGEGNKFNHCTYAGI